VARGLSISGHLLSPGPDGSPRAHARIRPSPPPPDDSTDTSLGAAAVGYCAPEAQPLDSLSQATGEERTLLLRLSDRFDVVNRIGCGGMGWIFKAFERQRGQFVIVKVMPEAGMGSTTLARWRELRDILAALGHPAILPLVDVDLCYETFR